MTATDSADAASHLPRPIRRAGTLIAGVLFVLYAIASHLAVAGHDPLWAIVPLLAAVGLLFALNASSHRTVVLAGVALLIGAVVHWHPPWIIYLPPTVLDLFIAGVFARSLWGGRTPLIERYLRLEHDDPPAWLVRHARQVTWLWTGVMTALGVIAAALAVAGNGFTWSLFVNVLSYVIIAAVFVLDYLYRLVFFPSKYHTSPLKIGRLVLRNRLLRVPANGNRPTC